MEMEADFVFSSWQFNWYTNSLVLGVCVWLIFFLSIIICIFY